MDETLKYFCSIRKLAFTSSKLPEQGGNMPGWLISREMCCMENQIVSRLTFDILRFFQTHILTLLSGTLPIPGQIFFYCYLSFLLDFQATQNVKINYFGEITAKPIKSKLFDKSQVWISTEMALGARWMVICQFLGQRTRTKSKASTFLYFQWFFMPNTINLSKFHGCPRLCFFVLAVQINIYARKKNGSGRNTSFIMPLPNMKSKASTFLHFQAFLMQLRRNSSKTPLAPVCFRCRNFVLSES